jgi:hypothetical protein
MAVSFTNLLYVHCADMFARSITVTPLVSNPSAGAYADMRAIFNSGPLVMMNDEGMVISEIADQQTIIDIIGAEFTGAGHVIPQQGDLVYFAGDSDIEGGNFEITEGPGNNSGGQLTYSIRKHGTAAP